LQEVGPFYQPGLPGLLEAVDDLEITLARCCPAVLRRLAQDSISLLQVMYIVAVSL